METSLHRQLKARYCVVEADREVWVGDFRVDAVVEGRLIEVQQASLAALRTKIRTLVETHDVLVVKPLAASTRIVRYESAGGPVAWARKSPTKRGWWHLFDDLVHFVRVFPHPRLTLEVVLLDQEEHRIPAPKRRQRSKDYRTQDRLVLEVRDVKTFRTAGDLLALLPIELPSPFSTAELAKLAHIPRWLAQKAAYCLRHTGAITAAGKRGHACLYTWERPRLKPVRKRTPRKAA